MSEPGLDWGVKESFVAYVSSLSDGEIATSGGATSTSDDGYHFPLAGVDDVDPDGVPGRVRFSGTVSFSGHWGMLRVAMSDPVLVLQAESAELWATVRGEPRQLATLPAMSPRRDETVLHWSGWIPTLTSDGAREFQGNYAAGDVLAALEVRVPLSGD